MLVNPTGYLKPIRDVGNLRIRELEEFLIIRAQLGFICDHSNLAHMRENIRLKIQSKNSPIVDKKQTYEIIHFVCYFTPSLWPILTTYLVVSLSYFSFFGPDWIYLSLHLVIIWFFRSQIDKEKSSYYRLIIIADRQRSIRFELHAQINCIKKRTTTIKKIICKNWLYKTDQKYFYVSIIPLFFWEYSN